MKRFLIISGIVLLLLISISVSHPPPSPHNPKQIYGVPIQDTTSNLADNDILKYNLAKDSLIWEADLGAASGGVWDTTDTKDTVSYAGVVTTDTLFKMFNNGDTTMITTTNTAGFKFLDEIESHTLIATTFLKTSFFIPDNVGTNARLIQIMSAGGSNDSVLFAQAEVFLEVKNADSTIMTKGYIDRQIVWDERNNATNDTASWSDNDNDTNAVFLDDDAGNVLLTVGRTGANAAQTLRIKVDTLEILSEVFNTLTGNGLIVASNQLTIDWGTAAGEADIMDIPNPNLWSIVFWNATVPVSLTVGAANTFLGGEGVTSAPLWQTLVDDDIPNNITIDEAGDLSDTLGTNLQVLVTRIDSTLDGFPIDTATGGGSNNLDDGDILEWNAANSEWRPTTQAGGSGADSAIIDFGSGSYKSSTVKAWSMKAGTGISFTTPTDSAGIDTFTVSSSGSARWNDVGTADTVSLVGVSDTLMVVADTGTFTSIETQNADGFLFLEDVTATTFTANGDIAAGDLATMGYTVAEGLILTGQGSTNDVTIKNDADQTVLSVPTGTYQILLASAHTTGTLHNLNLIPTAVIVESAEWHGIHIDGGALDPSGTGADITGVEVDFSGIDETNSPVIHGLEITVPPRRDAIHIYEGQLVIDNVPDATATSEFSAIDTRVDLASLASTSAWSALNVTAVGTTSGTVAAVLARNLVAPIRHETATFTTPSQTEFAGRETGGGVTWVDGVDGLEIFIVDNDEVFVGSTSQFSQIEVIMTTGANKDVQPKFYYNTAADTWTEFFPDDETSGFQTSSLISWVPSSISGLWTSNGDPGEGDTSPGFWIRIERTRNADPGSPTITTMKTGTVIEFTWSAPGDITANSLRMEGTTGDDFEQILTTIDPTADRTFTFPDDEIADLDLIIGTGAGTFGYAAMSGDATLANTGVLTIGTDKIDSTHVVANSLSLPSDIAVFTSAELAGRLSDETGTGVLVFNLAPDFTDLVTFDSAAGVRMKADSIEIEGDVIDDLTGTGLSLVSSALTVTGRTDAVLDPFGPPGGAGSAGPGDSVILELSSHDAAGQYVLFIDSSTNDGLYLDTIYIPFRMPAWANTLDSIMIVWKGKSATGDTAEISQVNVYGPDRSSPTETTDSLYATFTADQNSSSITTAKYQVANTELGPRDPFTVMIETTLGANVNGVVFVYSVYAVVSE